MANSNPRLVVRRGPEPDQVYRLTSAITIVGREPLNDVVIADPEVSRRHARIIFQEGSFFIEDLHSTNGTYVNGRRVTDKTRLASGDIVDFGETVRVIFEFDIPPAVTGEAQPPAVDLNLESSFFETDTPFPGDRATSRPMRPTVSHRPAEVDQAAAGQGAEQEEREKGGTADAPPETLSSRWFILVAVVFLLVVTLACIGLILYLNANYPGLFWGG